MVEKTLVNLREQAQAVSDAKTQFHKDYGKSFKIQQLFSEKYFQNMKNSASGIMTKRDKASLSTKTNFVKLDLKNIYFSVKTTSLMTTSKWWHTILEKQELSWRQLTQESSCKIEGQIIRQ